MENFKLGDRVNVLGKNTKGEIAFIGNIHISDGVWFGIHLDEAKGRNNGTMYGIRYFKCPRMHGVFVRACQIEKETTNNIHGNDKPNNAASCRITYPNYLKSSSKIKSEKHLCVPKNDVNKAKSQLKSINDSSSETVHVSDAAEKNTKLQVIKQENEDLKKKLEETEKSLQETLDKYNKAMVEIKQISEDLDSKKKQIKAQKFSLKLLKMRQCNHYKKIDSLETSVKHSCQTSNGTAFDELTSLVDGDFSDDELDTQSIITLSSLKRTVELEEQNRIMIEGLVELREFLMSQSKPQSSKNKIEGKVKRKHYCSLSNSNYSTNSIKNTSVEEFDSDTKDYGDVLRKMVKFTEIMKERGRPGKECTSPSPIILHPSGDCIPDKEEEMPVDNKVNQPRHLANQFRSHPNNQKFADLTEVPNGSESFQHSLVLNNCGFQNYLHLGDDLRADKSINVPTKMMSSSRLNSIGDTEILDTSNFENGIKQQQTAPKHREPSYCSFDKSLIQKKSAVCKVDSVSNFNFQEDLKYQPGLQMTLASRSDDMTF